MYIILCGSTKNIVQDGRMTLLLIICLLMVTSLQSEPNDIRFSIVRLNIRSRFKDSHKT